MGLFGGGNNGLRDFLNSTFSAAARATSDFRRDFLGTLQTDVTEFSSQLQATGQSLKAGSSRSREDFIQKQQGIVNAASAGFTGANETLGKIDALIGQGRTKAELQRGVEVGRLRRSLREIDPGSIEFDESTTTFFDLEGNERNVNDVSSIPSVDLAKVRRDTFNASKARFDDQIQSRVDEIITERESEGIPEGESQAQRIEREFLSFSPYQQALVDLFGVEGVDYDRLRRARIGDNIASHVNQSFIFQPELEAERATSFARAQENELRRRFEGAQSDEEQRVLKNAELLEVQNRLIGERSQLNVLLGKLGATNEQIFGAASVAAEGGTDVRQQIANRGRSRKRGDAKPRAPRFDTTRPA